MTYPVSANTGATYQGNDGLSGTYVPEIWSNKWLEKFYLSTVFAQISNTD